MSKKTLEVVLLGQSYKLVTDDSEEHVFDSARLVDTLVHDIEYAGVKDKDKAILLATLQLASRFIKLEHENSEVHTSFNEMSGWIEGQLVKLSKVF